MESPSDGALRLLEILRAVPALTISLFVTAKTALTPDKEIDM